MLNAQGMSWIQITRKEEALYSKGQNTITLPDGTDFSLFTDETNLYAMGSPEEKKATELREDILSGKLESEASSTSMKSTWKSLRKQYLKSDKARKKLSFVGYHPSNQIVETQAKDTMLGKILEWSEPDTEPFASMKTRVQENLGAVQGN
ncbi:MAG: hypothetical protein EOP09_09620, partial [Proteobacteria bacterium]